MGDHGLAFASVDIRNLKGLVIEKVVLQVLKCYLMHVKEYIYTRM